MLRVRLPVLCKRCCGQEKCCHCAFKLLPLVPLPPPAPFHPPTHPPPPRWQLPLLDKAAQRLLHGAEFEGLREQMVVFRTENAWVEQSALFR